MTKRPAAHVVVAGATFDQVDAAVADQNVMASRAAEDIIQIATNEVVIRMRSGDVDTLKPVDLDFGILVETPVTNVAQVNV